MVDPSDASSIKIPLCMLASGDEPAEDVKKFEANLKGEKHVETFGDQIHGWMAARSDLDDPRVKSEYERGYKTLLEFFAKYLWVVSFISANYGSERERQVSLAQVLIAERHERSAKIWGLKVTQSLHGR